jgi:HD-GYP domain-containing protein (c-di-GMP phosphodiesterase class II)
MHAIKERLPLQQVRDLIVIGTPLPVRILDARGRLLLNGGQVVLNEAQFDSLIERGAWAERSLVEAAREAISNGGKSSAPRGQPTVFDRWEKLTMELDKLSRGIVRRSASVSGLLPLVETIEFLVDRDPDAALFVCVRQDDRRFTLYPLTHAIHCTVVTMLATRQLEWPPEHTRSLACAALSMNLGMMELQAVMAEQDSPPTARQKEQIRLHPMAAAKLLRDGGVDDALWLQAVEQHHETLDGTGYPEGLTTPCEAARVLHMADVYMAKISPRAKRAGMLPQMAARQLFQERPGDPLAMAMIKSLGVHPPGDFVALRSGEIGVAIRRPATGTHPVVATLSDKTGRPSLQTQIRDTSLAEFTVIGPPADFKLFGRVLPERVYGFVAG